MGWWREAIDVVKKMISSFPHHFGGLTAYPESVKALAAHRLSFSLETWLKLLAHYAVQFWRFWTEWDSGAQIDSGVFIDQGRSGYWRRRIVEKGSSLSRMKQRWKTDQELSCA